MQLLGGILLSMFLVAAAPAYACQSLPMVFFAFDSTAPQPEGVAALAGFAQQAGARPEELETIRVIGHSDRTGSRAARERVALARAATVRDTLIAYGLPARLITIVGAGDRAPLAETADNVREPQNRRVELQIVWTAAARAAAAARREAAIKAGEPIPIC